MKKHIRVDIRLVIFVAVVTFAWNYYVFFRFMKKGVRRELPVIQSYEERISTQHPLENKQPKGEREVRDDRIGEGGIDKNVRVLLPYVPGGDFLFDIFNAERFTRGAEVGVAGGGFAMRTLKYWESCEKYYLIDPWKKQDDRIYADKFGNAPQTEQNKRYCDIQKLVEKYPCGEIMRNFSDEAATVIKDGSLDWVYIDARHDYKSVLEDLVLWFPKVKVGGVVSGHDYLDRPDGVENEWAIMNNGLLNKWGKSVKGAVDRFAQYVDVQVLVAASTPAVVCKSWYFRKIRDVPVDISLFEKDFEGLEPTEENLNKIRAMRNHEWLPAYDELFEWYDLPRELDYEILPHAHPLGGECKKVYSRYKEEC